MTLHTDIYEYDQQIKQARGTITLTVASITNTAQEHIQPTDSTRTAVNHSNYSHIFPFITSLTVIMCTLMPEHTSYVFNQQRIHLYFGVKMTSTLQQQGVATPCQHWAVIATNWWCHPCQHLYLYAPLGAGSAAISHPQIARFIYMFWLILMLVSSLN